MRAPKKHISVPRILEQWLQSLFFFFLGGKINDNSTKKTGKGGTGQEPLQLIFDCISASPKAIPLTGLLTPQCQTGLRKANFPFSMNASSYLLNVDRLVTHRETEWRRKFKERTLTWHGTSSIVLCDMTSSIPKGQSMVLTYDLTFVVDDLIGFSLRSSVKFVSLISMNFM